MVDIRFTASRAHKMLPVTLTAIMRWMRSADMSSTRADGADDAGIVDERAERSEFVGRLEQRENIRLAADIAFHGDRLAVLALDQLDDFLRRRLVAGVADHDAKAARGGSDGGGAADAAAAAGDHNNLVRHISPHKSTRIDPRLATPALTQPAPAEPDSRQRSSTSRAGSSRLSLTRTRNVTASLPSITR